jgi:mono/diheme cytochrome c family protein
MAVLAIGMCSLVSSPARAQDDAAALYKSKCAACHGADGTGSTPVGKSMKIRDFHSADVQKQSDADLTQIITAGKGGMPSYKGKLTDAQIKDLVGYIRTMAKK